MGKLTDPHITPVFHFSHETPSIPCTQQVAVWIDAYGFVQARWDDGKISIVGDLYELLNYSRREG